LALSEFVSASRSEPATTATAGCDDRVVRSCESPKPTSVVITIAKATTIEKKYARRENTITAAPSRTLLYCIKTKVAWNCNSPNNHRHDRPGAAPGWHADNASWRARFRR
jgi:hypothetical protein